MLGLHHIFSNMIAISVRKAKENLFFININPFIPINSKSEDPNEKADISLIISIYTVCFMLLVLEYTTSFNESTHTLKVHDGQVHLNVQGERVKLPLLLLLFPLTFFIQAAKMESARFFTPEINHIGPDKQIY